MATDFEKPSNVEDEYFAREDIEKLHKLAVKKAQDMAVKERDELKRVHHNHCPNCGFELHALKRGKMDVATCFNCQGVCLNKGQLEQVLNDHEGFGTRLVEAVVGVFQRWAPSGKAK